MRSVVIVIGPVLAVDPAGRWVVELALQAAQAYLRKLETVLAGGPAGEIDTLMDIEDTVSAALRAKVPK